MAYSIIFFVIVAAIGLYIYRQRRRQERIDREMRSSGEGEVIHPTTVLAVDLEDCVITESQDYYETPARRMDRFESLRSNYNPSADKVEITYYVMKFPTGYKGRPYTFRSRKIAIERATLMMLMIRQKQTTIDVYEDDHGNIEHYEFDLGFLLKRQ